MSNNEIQFLLYSLLDEEGKVHVVIKDETIWCTQKAMAQLFGVGVPAISKHLKNIFEEGELQKEVVVSKMEITTQHGAIKGKTQTSSVDFYNLDAIISVGYRVNSAKATRFRQWATKVLGEYIRKGFVLDDDRLKQGNAVFGKDYFRELLERVRSIRASERRIWQQITDIYAECSIDYDLSEQEIRRLERAVTGFFDYIEDLIERENTFNMTQFSDSVNKFLTFRNYKILTDKGKISAAEAKAKAEQEYDIFDKTQKIDSDFDKEVRGMLEK